MKDRHLLNLHTPFKKTDLRNAIGLALFAGALTANTVHAQTEIILAGSLNGTTGFLLDGAAPGDFSGVTVSTAGDINGDGVDDMLVAASAASPNNALSAGTVYVVFGRTTGFAAQIPLSSIGGTNGFKIEGVSRLDFLGRSVGALGDINGDGIDDVIIGAPGADPNNLDSAGRSYVIFGSRSSFPDSLSLIDLDGSNGFAIDGTAVGDASGQNTKSAGDLNGDNLNDIVIGAILADPNGRTDAGINYVVFGRSSAFPAVVALSNLDSTTGFKIAGETAGDRSGYAAEVAGDVNGDGLDDLIIGVPRANGGGIPTGRSYVIYGRSNGFDSDIDLANPVGGIKIIGETFSRSGSSVSAAGDFNGDGIDDFIIGAQEARPNDHVRGGRSYVVFGKTSALISPLLLSSLDGSNGVRIDGFRADQGVGRTVSAAGDVNGDGFDDVLVGAPGPGQINTFPGRTYAVFGQSSIGSPLTLSTLSQNTGFAVEGEVERDRFGTASDACDLNGDGIPDLIIGAYGAGPNGDFSGRTYVVFGKVNALFKDGFEPE